MLSTMKTAVAGIATAAMIAASSLVAVPAQARPAFQSYGQNVGYDGHGRDMRYDRRGGGGRWDNHHGGGNDWVAPLIGGLIIGGLVAGAGANASHFDRHDQYCASKFRTYNFRTNTYTGFDRQQHYC